MGILSALFLLLLGGVWWYAWRHGDEITLSKLEEVINSMFFPLLEDSVQPDLRNDLQKGVTALFHVARSSPLSEDDWQEILELLRTMQDFSNDGLISQAEGEHLRTEMHTLLSRLQRDK